MKQILAFALKTIVVSIVMLIIMVVVSAMALPTETTETPAAGGENVILLLFIVMLIDALVISLVVTQTHWSGWPLILGLTVAFYGIQTVVGQIEAIVFLTPLGEKWGAGSVPVLTMPMGFIAGQFVIGAAVAIIGVPTAVLLFGKAKRGSGVESINLIRGMGFLEWFWKAAATILIYILLYFGFGYFVAWKNPAVLAFYQGIDPGSFIAQMRNVISETPTLIPFQAFRALLWMAFTLPVIRMLRHKPWLGALITGLLLSLPMNIPHIVPNPYMPADVRLIHFIETASSNFIFGLFMFWLLHRSHQSLADLFRISNSTQAMRKMES
jgi:hypothetical protein